MSLLSKILLPVVGLAALVTVQCTAATPTATPSAQDYVSVTERTSGDGYKLRAHVVFGADGIEYHYVQFLQHGVEGTLVVGPKQKSGVLSVYSGTSDSAPYSAISGCDGTVTSFQDGPRDFVKPEQDPARAARIGEFLKGLYAIVGINPDCTIRPR